MFVAWLLVRKEYFAYVVRVFSFVHFELIVVSLNWIWKSDSGTKVMNGLNLHICIITVCVNTGMYL